MDVFKFSREINGIHHRFPRWELAVSVTRTVFKVFFLYRKIMPCAIREDLHRRKYQNHHLVIYGTVKHIHGTVVLLPIRSVLYSHKTVNPIGCCYEQDYAQRNLREKRHLQNQHLSVTAIHRTEN